MFSEPPVIIICFNNHPFVAHTIKQLRERGTQKIIVIDNASTWLATRQWLKTLNDISLIRNTKNFGHLCWMREEVFNQLPTLFAVTDPDLLFNECLPDDYLKRLCEIATFANASKVGFALDITEKDLFFDDSDYHKGFSIAEWEKRFWQRRIPHPSLELYLAPIDTTFHVFNKNGRRDIQLRVAGNFTARHLPWYRNDPIFGSTVMNDIYSQSTEVSTMARIHRRHASKRP